MARSRHTHILYLAVVGLSLCSTGSAQVSGTWNIDANGNWNVAGNWTGGIPGSGGTATFGSPPATASRTVTLNVATSLSGLTFNGTNSYVIGGTSTLTLLAPRTITVNAGTHEINAPLAGTNGMTKAGLGTLQLGGSNSLTGNTAVNAGVLRLTGSGNLGPAGSNNQLGMAFGGAVELSSAGTIDLGSRNIAFASTVAQAPSGALRLASGAGTSSGQWFFLSGSSISTAPGLTLTHTGDLIDNSAGVSSGLTKLGTGTLSVKRLGGVSVPSASTTVQQPLSNLDVQAGTVRVNNTATGDGRTGRLQNLSISSGATLDLNRSSLVWDYSGASPIAALRGHLLTGRVVSAVTGGRYGYAEASTLAGFGGTFAGQTGIDSTALVLRPTAGGDANLDGSVNFDDLLALAAGYNQVGFWQQGDFNYDGTVNFDDLLLLAATYNTSFVPGGLESTWSLARASIPEPTTALCLGAMSAGVLSRRRRM
jgi:fibronectin-binding autotransporter adhesin